MTAKPKLLAAMRRSLDHAVRHRPDHALVEGFILEHGTPFARAIRPAGIKRGPAKACFANAAELALGAGGYAYAEGFACRADMPPFLHAWCVRDGQAVDPTLPHPGRFAFLGVIIAPAILIDTLDRQRHYGMLTGSLAVEVMDRWRKTNATGK